MTDFTVAEVARRIRCSRRHALNLVRSGALPSILISAPGAQHKHRRVPEPALTEYLARIGRSAADWTGEHGGES